MAQRHSEEHNQRMLERERARNVHHRQLNNRDRVGEILNSGSKYMPHQGEREIARRQGRAL